MPSIASTSCAMISGRSGLPKFRLLVAATGSAPTVERLRQHSATSKLCAFARRQRAVAAVAVERHRDAGAGFLDPDNRRVAARAGERVGANRVVVLLPDPALGTHIGGGQQIEKIVDSNRERRIAGASIGALRYGAALCGRSYSGASSASSRLGISATTTP